MNAAVADIRAQEAALGLAPHLVTVQGTRAWGRDVSHYVAHPITAGGGARVVYETHPYNPSADFQALFVSPSQTLPVLIGEFGPVSGAMSLADAEALMQARGLPSCSVGLLAGLLAGLCVGC